MSKLVYEMSCSREMKKTVCHYADDDITRRVAGQRHRRLCIKSVGGEVVKSQAGLEQEAAWSVYGAQGLGGGARETSDGSG